DPTGTYAMAAIGVPMLGPPVLAVDAPALSRISLWPASNAQGAAQVAAALQPKPLPAPTILTGTRCTLTATTRVPPTTELDIVAVASPLDGAPPIHYSVPLPSGTRTYQVAIACPAGCRLGDFAIQATSRTDPAVIGVTLHELRQTPTGDVLVSSVQ